MAAEPTKSDVHVVEIPVTGDGAGTFPVKAAASVSGHHPLGEIVDKGGHLLLLKLWQREESCLNRRACALKADMDAARRDAFYLCAAFLALHGLSLALLFASSVAGDSSAALPSLACRRWWAPSSLSLAASLVLAAAVKLCVCAYLCAARRLRRKPAARHGAAAAWGEASRSGRTAAVLHLFRLR